MENKTIKVQFSNEEEFYEFKNAIIHGVEEDDDEGKLMSIIYGYKDVNDFITTYANIIVECYEFLEENYEYSDDQNLDVFHSLKNYTMGIFEAIKNGEFKNKEKEVIKGKI